MRNNINMINKLIDDIETEIVYYIFGSFMFYFGLSLMITSKIFGFKLGWVNEK